MKRGAKAPEDVVAEVQTLEPPLLAQQHDHDTARPVQTLPVSTILICLGVAADKFI
jgi:hypothetical protein